MTLSKKVKSLGLKSVKEVCDLTDMNHQTLLLWNKNRPALLNIVLLGCVTQRNLIETFVKAEVNKLHDAGDNGVVNSSTHDS